MHVRTGRHSKISGIVVAAGLGIATIGGVSATAQAADPAAVTPVVDCRVTRPSGTTVWFGYRNDASVRVTIPVGATNNVAAGLTSGLNRGQVEQFSPGSAAHVFGVTVPTGTQVTWTLSGPGLVAGNLTEGVAAASATSSASTPTCGAGVAARSASVQMVAGVAPSMTFTPKAEQRDATGALVSATVRLSLSGVVSACSAGGIPLEPQVLWGYGGPTQIDGGAILRSSGSAYGPVPADRVVRTEVSEFYTFVRTTSPLRPVVNPQQAFVFGTPVQQATGAAPFSRGLSSEMVIADVTGRCLFSTGVVRSRVPFLFDADGRPITLMTATDLTTQTTRRAVSCSITGQPLTSVCDNELIGVGPGTPRFR